MQKDADDEAADHHVDVGVGRNQQPGRRAHRSGHGERCHGNGSALRINTLMLKPVGHEGCDGQVVNGERHDEGRLGALAQSKQRHRLGKRVNPKSEKRRPGVAVAVGVAVFQAFRQAVERELQKVADDDPKAPGAARHRFVGTRLGQLGHPQKHRDREQEGARKGIGGRKPGLGQHLAAQPRANDQRHRQA